MDNAEHTGSNRPNNKRCWRCGAPFFCAGGDGKGGCWCDKMPHVGWIAGAAKDCLCPECLQQTIAAAAASRKSTGPS